jgi:hypothetical protein
MNMPWCCEPSPISTRMFMSEVDWDTCQCKAVAPEAGPPVRSITKLRTER